MVQAMLLDLLLMIHFNVKIGVGNISIFLCTFLPERSPIFFTCKESHFYEVSDVAPIPWGSQRKHDEKRYLGPKFRAKGNRNISIQVARI